MCVLVCVGALIGEELARGGPGSLMVLVSRYSSLRALKRFAESSSEMLNIAEEKLGRPHWRQDHANPEFMLL